MKKMMLVGTTGCGKTTLKQAIYGENIKYLKTQALDYCGDILDTPGEYAESPRFYNNLFVSAIGIDVVALLHDSSQKTVCFPPNFTGMFHCDVIGIITKTDSEKTNPVFSRLILRNAGVKKIFELSALNGTGVDDLKKYLH